MSKNTNISELINYLSYDGSGNIVFHSLSAASTNTDKFLVSDGSTLKHRTAAQLLSDIGAQASGSYQTALSGTGFVKISGSTISYDNSTYATETYVGTAISNLVASSPATLDTLNELALALGSDPNFATTVATSIGTKQAQLNGTGFVKVTGTTVSYDNSTYLTTTTAGTTYVPYTGANADVVLGTNNLKSKNTFAEGDGLYNGGGLRIKQYAFQTDGIDGYNTISSQTSGFAFSSSRGSGVFNNFILDPTSLPNNTQRSYILPNANGTLALTSDLSSYLPLAGGTLTGALSGTSATFTNTSTFRATGNAYTNGSIILQNSTGATSTYITNTGGIFYLSNDGSTDHLQIASTGAATFSSSVTATSLSISSTANSTNPSLGAIVSAGGLGLGGDIFMHPYNANQSNYGYIKVAATTVNTTTLTFGTTYGFGTNVDAFSLFNGATTFNGAVTANGGATITGGNFNISVSNSATYATIQMSNNASKDFQQFVFGSGRGDVYFGQAAANWAVQYTTAANGLMTGTYNNTSYIIGTNNTARLTFANSGGATFSTNVGIGSSNNAGALTIYATDARKLSIEADNNVRNTRLFKAYSVAEVSETWCRIRLENNYAQNYQGVWGTITVAYHPYHASRARFYQYNFIQGPYGTNNSYMKIMTVYEELIGWDYYSFASDVQFYNFENYLYIKVIGQYGGVNQIRSVTADLTGGNVAMDSVQLEVNVAAPARLGLITKNGAAVLSA